MPHLTRQAIARWAAVVLIVVLAYPLSYATVVRWKRERTGVDWIDGSRLPVYKPIDRLIDNSPLHKPLFFWAKLWGVEDEFRSAVLIRSIVRDIR